MNLENDMISLQYSDKTILRNLENSDNADNTLNTGHAGDMENSGNSVNPLDRCLHELIETGVKQHPDADALWFKGETLSYNALNQRANQCARYLRELGEGPNQIVAVIMERSLDMMVALLSILKAGATYLPLDPHYPRKRLNLILADAGVSVVFTQHSFEDKLTDFDGTLINLEDEWDYLAKMPNTDLKPVATPDDLAYVIYTSGSTGKPKGCMISHKAICNRLLWMKEQYQVTSNDIILQKTPFTFDVSVWELFLPLLSGACLVIAKPKGHQDNVYLIDTITRKGITICHFVPSMLQFFLNQPHVNQCRSLKHVFVSGEALPPELIKKFKQLLPAKLHNLYGPTEAAVDVTYWECTERADNLVPIGRPIPNIQIYILDSDLKQVPTGETGELYIGGIGLAKGYLNRRELTEKTFIKNPFSKNEHARLYKSGDKARYLRDGNIDYLGRLDFQVKLRGLRIELGEIELTLNAHEAIDQSIVLVKDQDTDDPKLVAYIVTQQDINPKQLREFLKKELPEYMVPNIFVPMADIPVTSHGKADRKSLPWPICTSNTETTRLFDPSLELIESKQDTSKLVSELVRMFSELLNITKIQAHDDLFDWGATSFTMVQIVDKIKNSYGVVVPVDVFLDNPNVAAITAYLASVLSTQVEEPTPPTKALPPAEAKQQMGKTDPSILNRLLEIFSEMLSNPKITVSDDLFDLGATSFTIVQAVEKIQQRLGVSVPVDVFLDCPRVDAITAYVEKECDKQADKKINCKNSSSSKPAQLPSKLAAIKLQSADFSNTAYDIPMIQRDFSGKTVSFAQFSRFLGLLKQGCVDDKSKYLYPSAGGLNSSQTYLFIKKDGVASLQEGAYYYHPIDHSLYPLAVPAHIDPAIMGEVNRKQFNQCGFALFLIVQLNAIWPIYKILSPSLSVLDAGYMSQLLLSRGQKFGLTLSPAVGVDFSQIRSMFLLEKSHRFIHCILGGNSDNVDMASSATDLLTDYLKYTGNGIFDHCKHYTGAETFSDYLNVRNEKQTLPSKQDKKDLKPDAYLRPFSGSFGRIRLEPVPNVDEAYYHARSTKRDYVDQPIPFSQFSLFLSLLAPKRINGQPRFLYSSLIGYRLKYYLYIPKNGVEGVPEGVYRYNPERLSLHQVTSALSKNIKMSHYPFNRTHVQKSKFCLFLFAPLADLTPVYKEESTYLALLEAGTVGQLLMDKQAEFEIGICPIGGMRFEKIRPDFERSDHALQPTDELLHSFVGGPFQVEMPADWHFLAADRQRQLNISDSYQRIERRKTPPTLNQEIAIVGISGRYPGATNLEEYWDHLKEGISSFSELWFDQAVHYRRSSHHTTTPPDLLSLTQRSSAFRHYAAFLDDVDCFDSLLFNITPAEAKQLDPQERLMLEVVWECLENAGYTSEELNRSADKVGVFVGAMWNDYQHHAMDNWKHSQTPLAMSHHSAIPSRVSYFFNFNGPCISLDTSCSSALAAIHYACNSLNNKECQAAIVGGVNIMSHPYHHGLLKSLDLLSADGECHPFGVKGSGWIAGEGVGAILIKPKINALKDGDTIHGIIKGSAIGHSGKSTRYGAPNTEKQTESILRAIKNAAISPESISYIEAAASGASIADASEMMALKTVFKNSNQSESMIYVGSVKSNIGHLESASAMSQLAKVLLQMKHQHICPTRKMSDLNPMIRIEDSNLKIINQLSPWTHQDGTPRRALINAFGATGTSGHLVIEEYIAPNSVESDPDSQQLITLSAATEPQLMHLAKRLNTFLANASHPLPQLSDIAYTLRIGRIDMSERLAIVTDSHAELQEKLTDYISGSPTPGVYTGSSTENVGFDEKTLLNDLADIAKAWVSKINYDWKKRFTGNEKRVPLPTYPFAKDRHWIGDNSAETNSQQQEPSAHPPTHYTVTVKQVEFYLKQQVSNVSEIPVSRIDSKALYDQFGMTSQMITQLTFKLENDFGHLPKTLFFEYQTIHDLAFYFLKNHLNQLSQVIAGQSKGVFDRLYTPSQANSPRKEASKSTKTSTSPVAIIGVAGRYPGANNLKEFWNNLKNGVDCISEIPTQRWNHSDYDQEDFALGTRLSKWGGFMEGVDQFDPLFFNISPREAELMDPQERLFLQTVWEMFEEAGYSRDTCQTVFNRKIGVFVGVMYGEYQLLSPSLYQRGHGTAVGSAYGSIANRISFFFDLKGPSLALDTLCSSSLTALHLAVGSIQSGECNGAIVGGVNVSIHPNKYIRQAQLNMPSTDGRCRSFGEGGNGFIPGEGVGAILLKPMDKAVADNDHIYAIINGTAINHDGKTHGYTVPNPNAQAEMIADALKKANIDPRQISYVEAHGTGTALGDPVEIAGLTQAFGNLKNRPRTCAIGSVKSNIGHLESAAGIAGLTKILLQFKHRQLVPSLHSKTLNPNIDFETGPFYVQQALTEWKHPRIACISSFGAGGANAHAILSEYCDQSAPTKSQANSKTDSNTPSAFMIPLSAKNRDRLGEVAKRLLEFVQSEVNENTIDQTKRPTLAHIAYTLQVGRDALEERLGMVVHSTQELEEKLKQFLAGEQTGDGIYLGRVKHTQKAVFETEDDLWAVLKKWVDQNKLSNILELWVKGVTVDWNKLVGPNPPKKISLPTYPFANDRYWVPEPTHQACASSHHTETEIKKTGRDEVDNNKPNNNNALPYSRLLATPVWREAPIQKNQGKQLNLLRQIILCELPQINGQIVESHFPEGRCIKLTSNESTIDGRLTEYAIQCFFHIRQIIDQNQQTTKNKDNTLIQLIIPNEAEAILFTALSGLFKTATLEHPRIFGQVLQVSPAETTQSLLEKLIDNSQLPQDDVVRYTDLKRFVTDWKIMGDQKEVTQYGFRDKSVYLITGGLGGLGRIFVNDIVQQTHYSTLILTGRSELSLEKQTVLKRLQEQNKTIHIEYRQTNVNDHRQVTELIKSICDQYGTLVGIIHCAGSICDNLIVNKSEDEFRQVLAPKVSGTLNLDRATADLDLELFVLFSSLSGVTGNLGQADYAVANGFLDQFAHYRTQLVATNQRRGITISINWPLWEEGGMDIDEVSKRMMIQSTGLIPLQTTTGIQSFYKCIAIAQPQIMVMEGSFEKIKNTFLSDHTTHHLAQKSQAVPAHVDPKILREKTLYQIKRLFGEVIKLPAAQVDEADPLESYGIDSVMIAHLNQKLMEVFGDIPRTLLFEYQTLNELTDYFVADFSATCCAWTKLDRLQEKVSLPNSIPQLNDTNQPYICLPEHRFDPIAIIGISGLYPQADTLEQYWENLKSGKNCITEIPANRWSLDSFYEPKIQEAVDKGKSYSKWGGFLDSFAHFDPLFFNISPRDAKQMDPQERLFLQAAWQAMENAGYTRSIFKEVYKKRVGVFAGITRAGFNMYGYYTSFCSVANRLSFFLDLQGPSMPVDTMCSSSLTAIHEACRYIHSGECELAFAGGVNLYLHPSGYVSLCSQRMLSEDGLCKSFGFGGNGFVPGEGVGVVILKRLSSAIADRDPIHAVIRATHVNHGGKTNGYTVPNPTAQADLIRHTLDKAGLTADQISYVEAHGTGTELGDPIEIAGLTQAFQKDTQATGFCKIGSVKSNIGHLESAAGIAGLTKIILQMKHRQVAPSLHAQTLNPNIRFETTPFVVNQTLSDWEQPMYNGKPAPRRAGISSFGAGGSNAHIIVEEYMEETPEQSVEPTDAVIIPLSARTKAQLKQRASSLLTYLESTSPHLTAVAYTLQTGREAMEERLGMIVNSVSELTKRLNEFCSDTVNIENCYQGNIKNNKETLTLFSANEELQEVVDKWIQRKKLPDLLKVWVNGLHIDWNKFYGAAQPKRLSLPPYPFANERYWFTDAKHPYIEDTEHLNSSVIQPLCNQASSNPPAHNIFSENAQKLSTLPETDTKLLRKKILGRLKRILGEVIDLPVSKIKEDEDFEVYGIDSITIFQLNQKLTEVFEKIPKTLFFEYQTLNTLADFFLKEHPQKCLKWAGLLNLEKERIDRFSKNTESRTKLSSFNKPPYEMNRETDVLFSTPHTEPIAIIGISGIYPQAETQEDFWNNLKTGKDCITEIPQDRWSLEGFYHPNVPEAIKQGLSYSKWGGFIDQFAEFDPLFFNISPKDALNIDPQERLFLQTSWKALEDAGYTRQILEDVYQQRVGVFVGITRTGFDLYRAELRNQEEQPNPRTSFSSVANRLSYFLNVQGPSMPIDTMCSSSLTAIHEACGHIHRGECELAIAGGVNLYLHPSDYIGLCGQRMLSEDGRCKSFGTGVNGFVPGEGVGVVILKRLSAAINDQDCIHAVIRATNVNHGGKTNGYTVPNPGAQAALIRETLDKAGINARRVSYIEAHGTGTELGDPIEITGLCQAFEQDTQDVQFCKIGAVKSNLGHLEAAAGIAGLTKVILQMKHGQIVPSLHSKTLNPNIDFDETPFIVNQELTPWQRSNIQGKEVPLIAGISSFGAGGSNAHILVEEYIEQTERDTSWEYDSTEPTIILLSARNKNQLDHLARNLLEFLQSSSPNLQSLAYTLQVGREAMDVRLGMIVESIQELKTTLGNYLSGKNIDEYYFGKIKENRDALAIFTMDEDLRSAIESWISKRKFTALLELWVKGLTIDWSRLYGEVKPRRISLPTYPFAKNRYWFKGTNTPKWRLNTGGEVSRLHPLLHTNTSDLSEQRFTSVFTGNEFFLNNHKVDGKRVFPGVAYLEMVRAAAERSIPPSKERKSIRLGKVVWPQPISIDESAKEIHVALFVEENTEINVRMQYEVYTTSNENMEKPLVHSQGFIELKPEEAASSINIEDIKNQMQQGTLNSTQCYQAFKQMGLNYGTGFQGIREIYKGDNQILAVLSLPSSVQDTLSDYVLHPSMMDSAFQSIIGLTLIPTLTSTDNNTEATGELASKPYLPFFLESLEIRKACTSVMYAWLRYSNGNKRLNDTLKLDITLGDEQGNVSVIMKGVTFKSLEGKHQTSPASKSQVNNNIGHLLAIPVWKETPISVNNSQLQSYSERRIVLCELRHIDPDKLESQISGSTCITLESKKDKIDDRFTDYATDCFQDIRQILKNKQQVLLFYQVIIPSGQEHTVFAGLLGLLKTATLENPKVIGQIITIDPQESIENLVKQIQENDDQKHDFYIKYENKKRFIRVWEEQSVTSQDNEFRFKNLGIYLITGGLGGLGLIFAKEILQQTKQVTLILTGRSDLSAEKQKILDELHQEIKPENHHIIKYYKTDVSCSEQVMSLIESIQVNYGKPNGIIHSAGIIQDNFIYKKTTEEFKNVLASKVSGAINLDIATQNTDLDFFVLFSSIAALGNIGQADYATANAFMDQFAHYRNELVKKNQRKGQTLSINWPFWEDGGMRVDEASKAMMKKVAGVLPMRTETGVKMLMHALSSANSQVLVIEGFLTKVRGFLFGQSDRVQEKRQITSSSASREFNKNSLRFKIQTMLLQIMSTTLKLNPQDIKEIDPEAEFNEYGFDSITLTDFANQINHTYSVNLVPTIFFEFPTLSRLTDYLHNESGTNFEELFQRETKETVLKQPEIKNKVFVRPPKRRTRFGVECPEVALPQTPEPVAIVGMSGCFPEAENLEQFWDNLIREKHCISEIPEDRWDWQEIYGNPHREVNKTNIKWGGFINSAAEFDPLFFGISSGEAELMDPQQRLLMTHVYKAMEDAGYSPKLISGSNTGIFLGIGNSGYHELIERAGIPIEGFSSTGLILSMGPNRMSYFLNLHGPSEPIETACSSSLVAIHRAVQAINTENCDAAFAGGINIIATPDAHISFSKAGMLCEDGRCKTFSNQANGYVRGEGVGILYLKKLKLAEQDGDHIYGLIKSSAENHGGRANSLTAPNPIAQAEVLKTAYQKAGLDPKTISYIETHGTGTELGDPIEINGLKTAFQELYHQFGHDRVDDAHCGLGSVKTNIGHLELAAGVAGVIKVLLQFKHQTLLKTLHCEVVNPYIKLNNSPFYIVSETKEWTPLKNELGQSIPRRAGVSSFGFGGTNAHIVLEEYIKPNDRLQPENAGTVVKEAVIIPISAKTPEQLEEKVKNLLSYLCTHMSDNCLTETGSTSDNQESVNLLSLAYTLQVGREEMRERLGLIVNSINELKIKLEGYLSKETHKEAFYRGQVKGKRNDSNNLSSEEDLQSTIETCIKKSDYSKILDLWVKGITIDWNKFYNNFKPTRICLPTYPFSKEKYWISSPPFLLTRQSQRKENGTAAAPTTAQSKKSQIIEMSPISPPQPVGVTKSNTPFESTDDIQYPRDKILSNMKKLFAKATKFPTAKIDENEGFETYGIDSILITRLNQDLTDIFGDISKTLFFEYQTLQELTDFFINNYPMECTSWIRSEQKSARLVQPLANSDNASVSVYTPRPIPSVAPDKRQVTIANNDSISIAIIGISGIYPQARNLEEYWQNLRTGKDCITEIPADRWSLEGFFCPDVDKAIEQGLSYSKWGGFIEQFAEFDPLFFNISPKESMSIDPQERLFLQMAWKALEDAGYTRTMLKETYQQKVGVFAGITKTGFDLYGLKLWQEGRKYFPHTSFSSVANRVSFFLNVRGPSMPIDTMCSSSLTAIHEACEHIHRGDCELALAGGVNLYLHPANYIAMCAKQMLSKDGQCKSFGRGGNGFVPGEGTGVVLLKSLSSAIRDKDAIHAVIRATQVNHGGKTNGYTVPNPGAQTELIRSALDKAGVNARHISYIEAHGTGTELGDPIEITGLTHAFQQDTQDVGFCKIGSVKSNLGHLEAAAGIAGLTKTILQMKHGKIVPSLHAKTVNPNISFEKTPFVVNQELTSWHRPQLDGTEIPRLAGISSFGAGGANAHVILEEYPDHHLAPEKVTRDTPTAASVIIPLSAQTQAQLDQRVAELLAWLKSDSVNLHSLAYTLQLGREAMEYRLGVVVSSIQELRNMLTDYLSKKQTTERLYIGNSHQLSEATALFKSEENQQQTIEKWLGQPELEPLLKLWVKGVTVDWGQFYTTTPQRLHLPTYPFSQKRYWIKDEPDQPNRIDDSPPASMPKNESLLYAESQPLATIDQTDSASLRRLRVPDEIPPFNLSENSEKPFQIPLTPLVTASVIESGRHAAPCQINDVLKPVDVLEDLKSAIPIKMAGLVPTLNRTGVMLEQLTPCSKSFVEFAGPCGGWVLDIGCAYGVATIAALEKGAHVFAVDMEQQHLDILSERVNEKTRHQLVTEQGMLPEVDFEKHSFAAIHASRVIHFLSPEEVQKTIRKMADWLQPGGKLFLISDTPYTGYWKSKASKYERRKAAGDLWPGYIDNVYQVFNPQETMGGPPRINPLDPDTLRRECEYVGLEVEYAGFEGVDSDLNTPESKQHNMEQAAVIAIKPLTEIR